VRKKALIAVFCVLSFCVAAQDEGNVVIVNSPANATNSLDEIRIEGFVPNFLKISLDFAPGNSAVVVGYYPSAEAANQAIKSTDSLPQGNKTFSIRADQVVDLGLVVLVSNVVGPYTISVFSANGGHLASAAPEIEEFIPYSLSLGDQKTRAEAGIFRFSGSGKSRSGGTRLPVQLVFDQFNPPLPHSVYTDELSFVVSAN